MLLFLFAYRARKITNDADSANAPDKPVELYVNQTGDHNVSRAVEGESETYTALKNVNDVHVYTRINVNDSIKPGKENSSGGDGDYECPFEENHDVRAKSSSTDSFAASDNKYQNTQFVCGRARALANIE